MGFGELDERLAFKPFAFYPPAVPSALHLAESGFVLIAPVVHQADCCHRKPPCAESISTQRNRRRGVGSVRCSFDTANKSESFRCIVSAFSSLKNEGEFRLLRSLSP